MPLRKPPEFGAWGSTCCMYSRHLYCVCFPDQTVDEASLAMLNQCWKSSFGSHCFGTRPLPVFQRCLLVPRCVASPGVISRPIDSEKTIAPGTSIAAKKVAIVSLGCPKNTVDGGAPKWTNQHMSVQMVVRGWTPSRHLATSLSPCRFTISSF